MKNTKNRIMASGAICGVLMGLAGIADAATWNIVPVEQDGRTPTQQLTNAVTQAASQDTISFAAGIYQLDGESYMDTSTAASSSTTITTRNYLAPGSKVLSFVGPAGARWENAVVLRGTGLDRFIETPSGAVFKNLTFENFAASDHPELAPAAGNLDKRGCGGAVFYASYNIGNVLSNCVFRGNVSRSGGALINGYAVDCLFTNNTARSYMGGAAISTDMLDCLCIDNVATNAGGALWWPGSLLLNSSFINNRASILAGAVVGQSGMVVSNCLFRGNQVVGNGGSGGAANLRQNARFIDCRFENNSSQKDGGAIVCNASGADPVNGGKGSRFDHCVFVGNHSLTNGGAISEDLGTTDGALLITDCVFSNNQATVNGGAVFGGMISNCTFVGNVCDPSGSGNSAGAAVYARARLESGIYGSSFVSNHFGKATGTDWGAAVYGATSNLVKQCLFHGNYVTNKVASAILAGVGATARLRVEGCSFSANYVVGGGVAAWADCTNTTFTGNEVLSAAGVLSQGRAFDSKFLGNRKYDTFWGLSYSTFGGIPEANSPAGDLRMSTAVNCEMDLGCIYDSVVVNCYIHSLTNRGAYCAFYGHNVATNCLIANCSPGDPDQRGLFYRWGVIGTSHVSGSDYVNCTFAENTYSTLVKHTQESGIATPFKNCLFYNNRSCDGTLMDVRYWVKDGTSSGVSLSNCVYGAVSSGNGSQTWADLGGNRLLEAAKVKVAGDRAETLGVHKYALRAESPVLGMGDATMFTSTDRDLAGNLRLRDGRLDPGCFECWLNRIGTMVLCR